MSLRLFSQVNDDSDLIEAWLNYYLRLGVDSFHLIVHGPPADNQKLLAIKAKYPITFEDAYQGPFPEPISTNKTPIDQWCWLLQATWNHTFDHWKWCALFVHLIASAEPASSN